MKINERMTVPAGELQGLLERGDCVLVDVREGVEWGQGHVAGGRHVPLGELGERCDELPKSGRLVVMCGSGVRSQKGADLLRERGFEEVVELHDGMQGWEAAGLAVEKPESAPWALDRQVRLASGALMLLGLVLALVWPPAIFLSWFVAGGLVFAALTNWCGMGMVLAKAPWNQVRVKSAAKSGNCSLGSEGGGG